MKVEEHLPIMVLVEETDHRLLFRFNSTLWGYLTFFIAIVLGIATYFAFAEKDDNFIVTSILGLLAAAFTYSSIYSFKLRRTLEIDGPRHRIRYVESSLYRNVRWEKEFREFEKIRAFRPIARVGSGGARKARSWAIQLMSRRGEMFAIGYSQFGALSKEKAEELATRVADMTRIQKEVIDD